MSYEKYKVDVTEGKSGNWRIERFTIDKQKADFERLRGLVNGHGRGVPEGTYTGLYRGNAIIMSDTPDEIRDHLPFILRATGRVLIAGLGLGMVAQAVANKPEVTDVTIVEQSVDVITLVGDHYLNRFPNKLSIVCNDIFE